MRDFFSSTIGSRVLAAVSLLMVMLVGYRIWASRVTPEKISAGQTLFEHEWTPHDPLSKRGDGLGPVFNDVSCVACHFQGGTGGAGPNSKNVNKFTVVPTGERPHVIHGVVHKQATLKSLQEDLDQVKERYPDIPGRSYRENCNAVVEPPISPVLATSINTPALFGLGLIEQIPSYSIAYHGSTKALSTVANEIRGKFSSKGFGRIRMAHGTVGKFGWKGEFGTIEKFVAEACAVELGLSVPGRRQDLPLEFEEDGNANYDMNRQQLHQLVCFVKSLPRPEQVLPTDESARARVSQGEQVFRQVGCADCHVPDLGGVEGIYSDFHLYNLSAPETDEYGSLLKNRSVEFPLAETAPNEWKTPPLWGVADSAPYFHDGSAETLRGAILMHRGDAEYSRTAYKDISADQQNALVEFLQTLRAPQSGFHLEKETSPLNPTGSAN